MLTYSNKVPVGWKAPDFKLPDTNGNIYQLYMNTPTLGTLIMFTCNHCPYAKAAWPLIIDLQKKYKYYQGKTIDFVAINSNSDEEYPEDSFNHMKKMVFDLKLEFSYLRDETQKTARNYQAQCTPDIYLLNKDKKLYYHGRINDNWKYPDKVKRFDLKDALDRLCVGDKPPVEQFPSMGCSIKWK